MKTTLDLPDDLIKKVKLQALHNGLKLKDTVAELLRKGLAANKVSQLRIISPGVKIDPKTGLPFFPSAPNAPITKLRAGEIYALIHQTLEEEDIERACLSLRR
jgi:hypothetical protein